LYLTCCKSTSVNSECLSLWNYNGYFINRFIVGNLFKGIPKSTNNHHKTIFALFDYYLLDTKLIFEGLRWWCLMPLSTIFQLHEYIMAVSFIGGGNQSTQRKPLTCPKSLRNFTTECCIEYTSSWAGFELATLVVIGTDCIYH